MHSKQGSVFYVAVLLLACQGAAASETKPAKAVGVAVPPEASNSVSSVGTLAGGKGSGAAAASYARESGAAEGECPPAADPALTPSASVARDSMPSRISTNATTPRQTQNASFGEKVNQGLHSAGGALAQGAAPVGAAVPGGAVISARCAKVPEAPPMQTPAATDK